MTVSPGKLLKKERESRNIPLDQISQFTKIKEKHLRAIEEDRYECLPPALYIKGYLNAYARYLALDPKEVVLQYQNYLKSLTPPEPIELPQQIPTPKKGARPWVFFSLILVAILFTTTFITYSTYQLVWDKPKPLLVSSISLSPPIQEAVSAQRIFPIQQNEVLGLEKPEAKDVSTLSIPDIKVLEASIGTGIEKEGLQQFLTGKCSDLTSNNKKGYFFTRIQAQKPAKIAHIWLWEGKEYHRIELEIKPPSWSVYSYFTFRPQHTGNWKAEVRDGDHILTSLNFKVIPFSEDCSL